MSDFDYSRRASDVNEANAALHEAVREDRGGQQHLSALKAFRATYALVYPDSLRQFDQGTKTVSEIDTADMLYFLEADPFFFRSGYMKEKLLTELKRRKLDSNEIEQLQAIMISVIQKPKHRREFLRYCRAAVNVDDDVFRSKLTAMEKSDELYVSLRANWMLAALDGKWLDLRRAARFQRLDDFAGRVSNPRIP